MWLVSCFWCACLQPSNFLLHCDMLLLNDFDLSALQSDQSNDGFEGGSPRFRSPFLGPDHRYDPTDDKISLVFTVVELLRVEWMDECAGSTKSKLRLLHGLHSGARKLSATLQRYVAQLMPSVDE